MTYPVPQLGGGSGTGQKRERDRQAQPDTTFLTLICVVIIFFFQTALLKCNLHPIKFTYFKYTNGFYIFTELCDHYNKLILEHFHHPKKTPHAH